MEFIGRENEMIAVAFGHRSSGDTVERKLQHGVVQDRLPVTSTTVELLGGDAEEN